MMGRILLVASLIVLGLGSGALAVRACFDCHSNETVWPWYSNVAPISWLVEHDVDEGRRALNFSEWTRPQKEAREAAQSVSKGQMPPRISVIPRGSAQLSPSERQSLIDALAATLGTKGRHRERER